MSLFLFLRYCGKLIIRKSKVFFGKIPPRSFKALINLNLFFNLNDSSPQILYLGDSVVERIANQDKDRRTLGTMVVDDLSPALSTGVISFSGYHMSVFYELLAALDVVKFKPQAVILPINIRSFSPQWDLQPRFQYEEEIRVLQKYRYSKAKVIENLYDERYIVPEYLQHKFRNTRITYPMSNLGVVGQFLDIVADEPEDEDAVRYRKQQIFIFNYGHPLAMEHRKLVKLTETLELLLDWKIKVFTYLTPINIDACVRYAGTDLYEQILKNIQVIDDVITPYKKNRDFHHFDWCTSLSSRMFFYDDLATEHLNQEGRLYLAKEISHEVRILNETGSSNK